MRFLRIFRFRRVMTRLVGDIACVIAIGDRLTRGRNRAAVHLHAVGAHVSDRAILIQALRDSHGVIGGKAQLARRFLLQGGGGEGRRRIAGGGFGLDAGHAEAPRLDIGLGRKRIAFVADGEPVDLVPAPPAQPRGERRAVMLKGGGHRPIFLGAERLDLALALDDQPQRDRLHPPRRFGAGQLAPQHRRERKPDQIIERAARAVSVDQIGIERARMLHRLGHGRLGNRVEGHAFDRLGQCLFGAQHFLHMP